MTDTVSAKFAIMLENATKEVEVGINAEELEGLFSDGRIAGLIVEKICIQEVTDDSGDGYRVWWYLNKKMFVIEQVG